jgi:putative hydrolase of the HAD superfamily
MIKGILLDYGGTIDTNGNHWGEVLWNAYAANNVPVSKQAFRDAYVFGEYSLATNPLIKPHHDFLAVLEIKIGKQFEYLIEHAFLPAADYRDLIKKIAADCNEVAVATISETSQVLDYLYAKYPLVLVSNFYGNIQSVLQNFGIKNYFKDIVESAVVGVRKPNAAIFSLGVQSLHFNPGECVVIGDSYSKDIAPGKLAGCYTIWLKGEGWGDDPADISKADATIANFKELKNIL